MILSYKKKRVPTTSNVMHVFSNSSFAWPSICSKLPWKWGRNFLRVTGINCPKQVSLSILIFACRGKMILSYKKKRVPTTSNVMHVFSNSSFAWPSICSKLPWKWGRNFLRFTGINCPKQVSLSILIFACRGKMILSYKKKRVPTTSNVMHVFSNSSFAWPSICSKLP